MRNLFTLVCGIAVFVVVGLPNAQATVVDDFSDLNDTANPTWTHLSGTVASTGQTWDASTGQYRMTAPNNGFSNLGFVGSYVAKSFSDVLVTADIVSFVDGPNGAGMGGPFAIAARLDGNNGFNNLKGYAYTYEPQADGGNGEFAMYKIIGFPTDLGTPIGVEGVDWIRKVTLDPNKDYRMTLSIQGNVLHGEIREIGGPVVAYQTHVDNVSPYTSGYSGLFAYSSNPIPPTDVTWDNFKSQVPEPATGFLVALAGVGLTPLCRRFRSQPNA
jgi:hypothetical protein